MIYAVNQKFYLSLPILLSFNHFSNYIAIAHYRKPIDRISPYFFEGDGRSEINEPRGHEICDHSAIGVCAFGNGKRALFCAGNRW